MVEWFAAGFLHDLDLPICGTVRWGGGALSLSQLSVQRLGPVPALRRSPPGESKG